MAFFKNIFGSSSSSSSPAASSSAEDTGDLRELIENMTRALVDDPKEIHVDEVKQDTDSLLYELRVSKSDLGKVIGKRGRTASAMRTILSAASRKHRVGADLRIVE